MKWRLHLLFLFIPAFLSAQTVSGRDIRIGYYENAPKIYSDAEGRPAGFHADLVKILSRDLNWNPVWVHGSWAECLDRMESGEIDMMVDVAYSRARVDRFYFNRESLFSNWAIIYTSPGKRMDSFYDIQGKKVATLENSIHTDGPMGILSITREFKVDFAPVMVGSYDEAFNMLSRGVVDAAVVNRIFGVTNESSYKVSRSTIIFDPVEIFFAFPGDPGLSH